MYTVAQVNLYLMDNGQAGVATQRPHGSLNNSGIELEYSEVDEHLFEKRRETKFLLKLDVCLMSWAWLAYLIKVGSRQWALIRLLI